MFVKTLKDLFERGLKRMVLQKATTSADSLGVAARGGSSGVAERRACLGARSLGDAAPLTPHCHLIHSLSQKGAGSNPVRAIFEIVTLKNLLAKNDQKKFVFIASGCFKSL